MGRFRTFAYGSNMDLDDFKRHMREKHCKYHPITIIGKTILRDYKLVFDYKSISRGCGVANIIEHDGDSVEGLILEMDDRLRECLRNKEGYYSGIYDEIWVVVEIEDESSEEIMTYQVVKDKRKPDHQPPKKGYRDLILNAAKRHDFSEEYIKMLENVKCIGRIDDG